ncbi:HK97 gp10 family phage protein [Wohlfahrtiimonas populi]|uniref:HK97 gp10 family phage protein n=1 Tax=Wohlfahrtiimonas populi TaxID=1940240 RepID=UPI00098D06D3|nr:HK97 gp10 family phage protein [Wohlfahrtiimonas populi]
MSIKDRITKRKAEIFAEIEGDLNKASNSLLSKIQAKVPVDSGELEISWKISQKGDFHYVVFSPSAYAHIVEYGLYPNPPKNPTGKTQNGFSIQAPKGYARISLEEVKNEFKRGS